MPTSQLLLGAISEGGEDIEDLIDQLVAEGGGERSPAESDVAEGRWRLVWSAQVQCIPSLE